MNRNPRNREKRLVSRGGGKRKRRKLTKQKKKKRNEDPRERNVESKI